MKKTRDREDDPVQHIEDLARDLGKQDKDLLQEFFPGEES
jgi:hypothetical protein